MSTTDTDSTTSTDSTTDNAGSSTEPGQDGANSDAAGTDTGDNGTGAQNGDSQKAGDKAGDSSNADGALGDAGKKALDAMKAERKAAREAAAAEKARADALQAKLDGKEAEFAEEQKKREAEAAALAKADERILKAEVRAQAATKLTDPADALRFIDLSEFEVDSDGGVDADAISAAIDDLITQKPYLSAQGGTRFQGSADGGARNDSNTKPKQLTEADVKRLEAEGNHEEIVKAQAEGRLADYLAS